MLGHPAAVILDDQFHFLGISGTHGNPDEAFAPFIFDPVVKCILHNRLQQHF
ncbi:hypothetical protein D3C77_750870 [compost metagenome]